MTSDRSVENTPENSRDPISQKNNSPTSEISQRLSQKLIFNHSGNESDSLEESTRASKSSLPKTLNNQKSYLDTPSPSSNDSTPVKNVPSSEILPTPINLNSDSEAIQLNPKIIENLGSSNSQDSDQTCYSQGTIMNTFDVNAGSQERDFLHGVQAPNFANFGARTPLQTSPRKRVTNQASPKSPFTPERIARMKKARKQTRKSKPVDNIEFPENIEPKSSSALEYPIIKDIEPKIIPTKVVESNYPVKQLSKLIIPAPVTVVDRLPSPVKKVHRKITMDGPQPAIITKQVQSKNIGEISPSDVNNNQKINSQHKISEKLTQSPQKPRKPLQNAHHIQSPIEVPEQKTFSKHSDFHLPLEERIQQETTINKIISQFYTSPSSIQQVAYNYLSIGRSDLFKHNSGLTISVTPEFNFTIQLEQTTENSRNTITITPDDVHQLKIFQSEHNTSHKKTASLEHFWMAFKLKSEKVGVIIEKLKISKMDYSVCDGACESKQWILIQMQGPRSFEKYERLKNKCANLNGHFIAELERKWTSVKKNNVKFTEKLRGKVAGRRKAVFGERIDFIKPDKMYELVDDIQNSSDNMLNHEQLTLLKKVCCREKLQKSGNDDVWVKNIADSVFLEHSGNDTTIDTHLTHEKVQNEEVFDQHVISSSQIVKIVEQAPETQIRANLDDVEMREESLDTELGLMLNTQPVAGQIMDHNFAQNVNFVTVPEIHTENVAQEPLMLEQSQILEQVPVFDQNKLLNDLNISTTMDTSIPNNNGPASVVTNPKSAVSHENSSSSGSSSSDSSDESINSTNPQVILKPDLQFSKKHISGFKIKKPESWKTSDDVVLLFLQIAWVTCLALHGQNYPKSSEKFDEKRLDDVFDAVQKSILDKTKLEK